ncbi:unnamed protein product [Meloidogyne enterolobii]|uniref:Uncharacterized protein n=1 Tax=Meloidogyne enterolobii TaxID=390850 RepID=A0ACB1AUX6_MELEN
MGLIVRIRVELLGIGKIFGYPGPNQEKIGSSDRSDWHTNYKQNRNFPNAFSRKGSKPTPSYMHYRNFQAHFQDQLPKSLANFWDDFFSLYLDNFFYYYVNALFLFFFFSLI